MTPTLLQKFSYIALSIFTFALPVQAMDRTYQTPEDFVAEIFPAKPKPALLWLTANVQAGVTSILGHAPSQLRQRYWSEAGRTLWILEEIGKEDRITTGFVVSEGRIERVKVLVYRESRGMEVRFQSFLDQFRGGSLIDDNRLDKTIDGIAGATLSVHAMQRMARVALYFDRVVRESAKSNSQDSTK